MSMELFVFILVYEFLSPLNTSHDAYHNYISDG